MTSRVVTLSGHILPAIGQGTWNMAEDARKRRDEIAALQRGIDLGLTLIDTAEMYADGGAEELTGEAIAGRRDGVFLVSKVLPNNASRRGAVAACERSLKRLRTDRIDLYLLHWRGSIPLEDTLAAFNELKSAGKIGAWGVSNFDVNDMRDLAACDTQHEVATNQVLYNLTRRGIEFDLLPQARAAGLPIMAYSPIEQGRLLRHKALGEVAARHGVTAAQAALAWTIRRGGVIAIPKTSRPERVAENHGALNVTLTTDDLATLDEAFPPPTRAEPLAML